MGASLGADSIESGKKAALMGLALVMIFMVAAYGLFGMFANIALIAVILAASIEAARQLGGDEIAIFLAQVTALGGKVIFGTLIIVVGIFLARIVANLVGSGTGEAASPRRSSATRSSLSSRPSA